MSNDADHPLHTGGCQCGRVRYAITAPPKGVHFCHCRMCQKAVGGPFAAFAPVKRDTLTWTRGRPAIFQSSTVAERGFCPACGTPLTFAYTDSDWIDVTLGSLDDPDAVEPDRHYGSESRIPWLDHMNAWRVEPVTEEEMTPERRARIVNLQHPDHDTPDGWHPPPAKGKPARR